MPKDKMEPLRNAIKVFRETRENGKKLTEAASKQQQPLIEEMQEFGVDNETGIVWDESDPEKGVAFVQQNSGSLVWDEESILDYISRRPSLRTKATSRTLDMNKWEALVASGEVPPKVAKRMQRKTDPPKPFIRFGKPKKGEDVL